jgi:hypothetical protein
MFLELVVVGCESVTYLKPCMSRSRPLGRVRLVLLSVVAQTLVIDLLCVVDPSFFSSDADDGYQ